MAVSNYQKLKRPVVCGQINTIVSTVKQFRCVVQLTQFFAFVSSDPSCLRSSLASGAIWNWAAEQLSLSPVQRGTDVELTQPAWIAVLVAEGEDDGLRSSFGSGTRRNKERENS
jgi:hypothetical protein